MFFFVTDLYDSCRRDQKFSIYIKINGKIFQPKTNFTKAKWKRSVEKTQRPKTLI